MSSGVVEVGGEREASVGGSASGGGVPALIRLEHINKTFGEQKVLDDYCLDIAPAQTRRLLNRREE